MSHTPTHEGHVNPFSQFQPLSLSFKDDGNFLNNFNDQLSNEFADLDRLGVDDGSIGGFRLSDQTRDRVNLNNVGNGFLEETRIGSGGVGRSRSENYSYVGNLTNDSTANKNHSLLFDSRATDNDHLGGTNNNNDNDSFRSSTLHKQNSFINSIRNQQNQRLSQDSFITRHLTPKQQPHTQQTYSQQPTQQPPTLQPPTFTTNVNYNQSIPFDNFHGDENILDDNNEFSFNVSNPNIGDTEFYGSTTSQNRFNNDNNRLGSIGNYRTRQNGSANFTDTNGNQSVNDHSLMYSPATNYQEYDQDDIQDNNQQQPQYQQPPQVEEHYNNSQYSNNHSAFNQNIQVEGEARTPGTYFQDRSPNMGNLSGHGTHIEFGDPINDLDYNNINGVGGNNNNNFEEELNYRNQSFNGGSSMNGGVPGSADGAGISGNGLSNPNTPNGSMRMGINSSRINGSNYISPIVSTNGGIGGTNGGIDIKRHQQSDNTINTSYSSINIPPHASPVGYTPERGNLSIETYERLKNKFESTIMNPRNQQTQPAPRQQTQPPPQTPPQTQPPPRQQTPETPSRTSVYTSTITNESQYLQHLQQQKLLELQQQRRREQDQQNRSPPRQQPNHHQQVYEEEQINDNNLTIKYPMVQIEKRIDFESCEIEWVLNKDVIITNPHSKPITLTNISIYGSDKDCFKLIMPNDKLKNSKSTGATITTSTTTPPIIIIQPLSSVTISIEYSPTFNNLPNFIDQFQNQANLVFTCSSTIPSHLDDFSSSEFTIHHIPSGGVFNLSIPIIGSPTQQVNNSDQLIYSYNSWDMGECDSNSTSLNNILVSNLSLKYPKGNKLIYKIDGLAEGFSFEKTSNEQISLKFQPPEKQIYNAISYVYDPNSGQKKIINLSATVNNKSTSTQQQPQSQQSPTIIDPSPSNLSPSQQPKQTKSFTPNFIEETSTTANQHQDNQYFENIENNNYLVPLKISNYVLENGIKLIYEERKGVYPIEILPIYCNRGTENITVECISTQPDVFLIEPSTFTIKPNGIVSLQIKYQPTKHLQSQRAAIIISTPSVTKEKIKIDVVGVTLSLESTLYIPSSPPSPTYQSKKFNNIKKDNYNATNISPTLSSSNGDDEYNNDNINNTSVIFHDSDDDISKKIPSLYCNKKAIDFGGIKLGDTQSVTITLTSTLAQALHFNITFADQTGLSTNNGTGSSSSGNNALFSIAGGNQLLVGSNSKTEVEIIYTPLSVAPHGTVVIFSSLNNQFQFSIPVFGYGGKSKMEIVSSTRSLMDSNNTLILYVNKQTADGKSLYCNFTVKNTGQRAGFIRAFSFYPSTRSTIKPDRVILGIGESFEFRLDIHSTDNSGLTNNLLLNSTASPGKVKLFFGDELSRQRKIRSVLNRLDNLKLTEEDDYDSDFLYDYKFKDDSTQDIKFKELFIAKNNSQIIQQPDGYSNQFTFDDYDDDNVELFYKQLSSLKIKPIIGNPPSSSFNQSTTTATTNTTNTSSSSPLQNPQSNNQFNLSEMEVNNTPFRATTHLPYPPKSILKKQPETSGNNLFNTFENSKSNPSMQTTTPTPIATTATGMPKVNISEEVYHYHIHQFENEQKVEIPPIGPTSGILFFNEKKKVFGIIQPGQTFTNKILVSNASNTTLNVKLSNTNYPFSLVHHSLTLNPKTTTKVPVTFSPKEVGVFSQTLMVESIPKVGDPTLVDRCELIGECKLSF